MVDGNMPGSVRLPEDGRYLANVVLEFSSSASGNRNLVIQLDGGNISEAFSPGLSGDLTRLQTTVVFDGRRGQRVRVLAYQTSGADLTITSNAQTHFEVVKIN